MVWSQYSILNIVIHGAQTPKYKIVHVNHLPEYCPVMQNRYTSQKRRTINLPYKQFVWILFEFEESLFFYPGTLWKGNAEIRTSSNL